MFIVLGAVAAYRALLGGTQAWTFVVYLPVLAICCVLACLLERLLARSVVRSGMAGLLRAR
jgi:hypothetical protein